MSKETNENGRRQFTPEQKFKVVKEALTTDLGVSGVCRKYGISATNFYQWQEKFFAGAVEGLKRGKSEGPTVAQLRKMSEQEQKISRMQNVIAEITAENIDFKKKLGDF
jgi:transposase-like protein